MRRLAESPGDFRDYTSGHETELLGDGGKHVYLSDREHLHHADYGGRGGAACPGP